MSKTSSVAIASIQPIEDHLEPFYSSFSVIGSTSILLLGIWMVLLAFSFDNLKNPHISHAAGSAFYHKEALHNAKVTDELF